MSGPFEFTAIASAGQLLSKRIALRPDGSLHSDGSACLMSAGSAARITVDGLGEFARHIERLRLNEAIALGALRPDLPAKVTITTASRLAQMNGAARPNVIARTAAHISYIPGKPALALADFDAKGMPAEIRARIDALGGFHEALLTVLPALEQTGRVIRRSTSSGLSRSDTGKPVPGSDGQHCYVAVRDGGDIGRFLDVLHDTCWLAGFGWLMLGAGGQILERSIIDKMVAGGERLVFEGGPALVEPLVQDAALRRPEAIEAEPADTRAICPDLTASEAETLSRLKRDARARLKPEATRARAAFITAHAKDISERTGATPEDALSAAERLCRGDLIPASILHFDGPDLGVVSVADMLADPARFVGQTLADPLEGVAYGIGKAKVMQNRDGTLWISSFAHGRTKYKIPPGPQAGNGVHPPAEPPTGDAGAARKPEAKPQPAEAGENVVPDWAQYLQRDERGAVLPNLASVMTALRSAPELRDCFGLDLMAGATMLVQPVPGGAATGLPRPVQDGDVSRVQEWLQRRELRRLGKDTTHQAVDLHAESHDYHPVLDYLRALRWDKTQRLATWLSAYLGVEQSTYASAIGQWFLISMIARVSKPGVKVDTMLVLEGDQGVRKSAVCAILGGPWYSDSLPDLRTSGKDVSQHLSGRWLIEVPEMSAMDKTDTETLKAFLTRREERYRPPYSRREVTVPRQCCFIGTTNKAVYLRDETGGRRFWPCKTGQLDIDRLIRDRDQIFAEAVHLYGKGVKWWPDADFEAKHIRPEQAARYDADAWEQEISEWINANPEQVTVLKVARWALSFSTDKIGTRDQRRIAAAMEQAGWMRNPLRGRNGDRYWMPRPST